MKREGAPEPIGCETAPRVAAALLVLLLLCGGGCERCDRGRGAGDGISLHYTVDATRTASGSVQLQLRVLNLPAGQHAFIRGGSPNTTVVRQVTARAGDRSLPVAARPGPTDRWSVTTVDDGPLVLSWQAHQGGRSRHGHEGYLGRHFGLVDGGVFLLPEAAYREETSGYSGRSAVERIRVTLRLPTGWQAVSTMASDGDAFDPAVAGRWAVTHLAHCNIGLGQFDLVRKRIGGVTARVYVYRGWSPQKKKRVASGALQIHAVFDKQAPFEGLPTYTTIFLPAAPDRKAVTGQFWSTGQAFSFDAYEHRPRRVWELYAHRLAHGVNRYHICGTQIESERERWFVEGWASWTEVTHTIAAKVVGSEQQLVKLGKRYRAIVFGLDPEVKDVPVFHEARRSYRGLTLYLHYTKGPLVVQQLDYLLRRRSGGKKTVNGFVRATYPKYRNHRAPLPLKRELERYLGSSLDAFFREQVDQPGYLYPVHEGFLEHLRKTTLSAEDAAAALRVDGSAINRRQHRQLGRLLGQLGVNDPAAMRQRLVDLLLVFNEYRRRGLDRVPPEMIELADRLPASVRLLMFRHQKALLFGADAPAYSAWLAKQRAAAKVESPR